MQIEYFSRHVVNVFAPPRSKCELVIFDQEYKGGDESCFCYRSVLWHLSSFVILAESQKTSQSARTLKF